MATSARLIPMTQDILNHRRNLGSSIWEYLWLLTHVNWDDLDGDVESAVVDRGQPVPTSRIAEDLQRSRETVLANLERLVAGNYITRSAVPGHAYSYRVCLRGPADVSVGR